MKFRSLTAFLSTAMVLHCGWNAMDSFAVITGLFPPRTLDYSVRLVSDLTGVALWAGVAYFFEKRKLIAEAR